uniref:Uncharacterized protein n=1 Tax=viral metagenome TaxID=1070528 RepID=A0A6C0H9D7_9ZZZZ
MTENIPKEHYLFEALREDPNVYIDDKKNDVKIGDTIEYIANNQLGKRKYNVIESLDENGNVEKGLEEIDFTPSKKMALLNDFTQTQSPKTSSDEPSIFNFHWYPDDGSKGGKKKHKKTQHKRNRKQRFKSKSKSKMMKSKKYRRTKK